MKKRKLILCEGKHDSIFFEKLFHELGIPLLKVKFFDQEANSKLKVVKNAETRELRKFSGDYNPHKILVKSEGGKNKVIIVFSSIMNYCIKRTDIEKTILMLDLDGLTLKKQLYGIEQRVDTHRAGESISIEWSTIKKTTSNSVYNSVYLIKNKVKIKESKKQIGIFYLILFTSSLEKAADINDSDDTTTIERKISELVEMPNIREIFSLVFSGYVI